MTQKQLIELINQHHPGAGETEVRLGLNRAKDDFCAKTEIVKDSYTGTTVANQRYYDIDDRIIKIKSLWLNDIEIPRALNKPSIDDEDDGEYT